MLDFKRVVPGCTWLYSFLSLHKRIYTLHVTLASDLNRKQTWAKFQEIPRTVLFFWILSIMIFYLIAWQTWIWITKYPQGDVCQLHHVYMKWYSLCFTSDQQRNLINFILKIRLLCSYCCIKRELGAILSLDTFIHFFHKQSYLW